MPELEGLSFFNDANLQAYYKLEDVNDNKDGFNLTNNGITSFNAAQFGNGADFGASNTTKYLSTTSQLGIDGGAISFSFWAKMQTEIGSGLYALCSQGNNTSDVRNEFFYDYNVGTRRIVAQRTKTGSAADFTVYNVTLGTSAWNYFALTYDGTTVTLYFNGLSVATIASSGNGTGTTTDGFSIGADIDAASKTSAIIDDLAVFNRALTASEILNIYSGQTYLGKTW